MSLTTRSSCQWRLLAADDRPPGTDLPLCLYQVNPQPFTRGCVRQRRHDTTLPQHAQLTALVARSVSSSIYKAVQYLSVLAFCGPFSRENSPVWHNIVSTCGSMADIQSATAETRRGKKKEEEERRKTTGQKYNGLPYSIGRPQKRKINKYSEWTV